MYILRFKMDLHGLYMANMCSFLWITVNTATVNKFFANRYYYFKKINNLKHEYINIEIANHILVSKHNFPEIFVLYFAKFGHIRFCETVSTASILCYFITVTLSEKKPSAFRYIKKHEFMACRRKVCMSRDLL